MSDYCRLSKRRRVTSLAFPNTLSDPDRRRMPPFRCSLQALSTEERTGQWMSHDIVDPKRWTTQATCIC